jgi:hypothetical protein
MKTTLTGFYRYKLPAAVIGFSMFISCSKILDKNPETSLSSNQVYRNVFDADAAVIGTYGKLMGLAKQYIVLNELRGDLMEITPNANEDLKEMATHQVSPGNQYANPKPFYAIINDCNDVLKHFTIMRSEKKFKEDEYQQRYSDIGALRSWLYLQLGIHFGTIPYVTDPLENIDVAKDQSKYPFVEFPQLLDSLIGFMRTLPFANPYPPGTSLLTNVDGSSTQAFFISKQSLLGDLYLWQGKKYDSAAYFYRQVMESTGYFVTPGTDAFFNTFRVKYADVSNNNDLAVGYVRNRESDINMLIENNSQGWRSMFARGQDALWNTEWIWVLPFNSNFSPQNPFIDLFANNSGKYQLQPSIPAMNNWNRQLQSNGFPFDARGNFTWKTLNGQPIIMEYLYQYLDGATLSPINPLLKNGQWFLNRAAAVHLHFAEAANRAGYHRLAYAITNNGIPATYPAPSGVTDVTNYQNTMQYPKPYDFDARMGDYPRYRGDWHRHAGVRGRARLVSDALPPVGDSTLTIENAIINEGALELAYEGHRWPDLLRIAIRRNDRSFLADKVYEKLSKDNIPGAQAARSRLIANYYLPFNWK